MRRVEQRTTRLCIHCTLFHLQRLIPETRVPQRRGKEWDMLSAAEDLSSPRDRKFGCDTLTRATHA